MRALPLALALVAAACGDLHLSDGTLRCSVDHRCPEGYHCAADDRCWPEGRDPVLDLSLPDQQASDLAMSDARMPDAQMPDLAMPDAQMPDLAMPDLAPVIVPPAAVWISSGGGAGTDATSHDQLNLCIGGSVLMGGVTGSQNATVTYGLFSSSTY
jgi:hypothetical protein